MCWRWLVTKYYMSSKQEHVHRRKKKTKNQQEYTFLPGPTRTAPMEHAFGSSTLLLLLGLRRLARARAFSVEMILKVSFGDDLSQSTTTCPVNKNTSPKNKNKNKISQQEHFVFIFAGPTRNQEQLARRTLSVAVHYYSGLARAREFLDEWFWRYALLRPAVDVDARGGQRTRGCKWTPLVIGFQFYATVERIFLLILTLQNYYSKKLQNYFFSFSCFADIYSYRRFFFFIV